MAPTETTKPTRYHTLAEDLRSRIDRGEFEPGEAIPPVLQLSRDYEVAPMTARRALGTLRTAGVVTMRPGVGTFVAKTESLRAVVMLDSTWPPCPEMRYDSFRRASLGCKEACSKLRLRLMLANLEDDPDLFLEPGTGVVVLAARPRAPRLDTWLRRIARAGAPMVATGENLGLPNPVFRDRPAGMRRALRYLYGLGHRRVALFGRFCGNEEPLLVPAAPPEAQDLVLLQFPYLSGASSGSKSARRQLRLLEKVVGEPGRPTALVTDADRLVDSVLCVIEDRGLRIPDDISIVLFAPAAPREWEGRKLTYVESPRREIGMRCVEELARMAEEPGYTPGKILIQQRVVLGETCAPPPGGRPAGGAPQTGGEEL